MSKLEQLINSLCPNGVEYKTIGDICTIKKGVQLNKDKLRDEGKYPVINGGINPSGYWDEYNFEGGLITISQGGASAGYVNFINMPFWAGAHCYVVESCKEYLNYMYLYHFIKMQQKTFMQCQYGAGIPGLGLKSINSISIPIPPLPVQEEIVRILDKFMELTSELTTKLTSELAARKQQYEYYFELLLNFREEYDWKKIKLKEICDIYLGLTATPKYTNSGVKFISAQNTSKDFLDLENVKYISEIDYAKATSNAKPKRDDILFTRVGSNLGHPVIVDTDEKLCIFVSLGFLRIKNKNIVSNSYLKHWMNTDLFWSQVRKKVFGAAKVNLNTGWLKEFELTLPPIDIQKKIVNHLDCFKKHYDYLHNNLSLEIKARQKQYEYYRDKLLTFKKKEAAENE